MKKTYIFTLLFSLLLINVGFCQTKSKSSTKNSEKSINSKMKELEEKIKKLESNNTSNGKGEGYSQLLYIVTKIDEISHMDDTKSKIYHVDCIFTDGTIFEKNMELHRHLRNNGSWEWSTLNYGTLSFREIIDKRFNSLLSSNSKMPYYKNMISLGYRIMNETNKTLD